MCGLPCCSSLEKGAVHPRGLCAWVMQDSVMGSLALGGQQLMGQTVMVKSSEAEKNLAWEAAQVPPPPPGARAVETGIPPAAAAAVRVPFDKSASHRLYLRAVGSFE